MRGTKVLGGLAAIAASIVSLPASAVTVTYCGPNVCYQYDNAQAAVAWFGLPSFVGDSAYFTPTVFEARSADGVGIHSGTNTDVVDATWVFSKVYSVVPSNEIASIVAYEEGDYEINYAAGETHGDLYLRARGLNNLLESSIIDTDAVDNLGSSGGIQLWSMTAGLTPAATLTQLANNMTVTIQNTLAAFTSNSTPGSELAWIEKKLVLDITTVVPVPAAAWLMGSALGLLGFARRRMAA
ncbi:MAG: VPLPA-CTERM sorting domain-containing protein [Gammaproteobacteria bacterium]